MEKLSTLLTDAVEFTRLDTISQGLTAKYGADKLEAYTFGIELEYTVDVEPQVDFAQLEADLKRNQRCRSDYDDWLSDQRKARNRRWLGDLTRWDDTYGPLDPDTFSEYEPVEDEKNSGDEFDEQYKIWKTQNSEVTYDYNRWLRNSYWDHFSEFMDTISADDYLPDLSIYDTSGDISTNISEAITYIRHTMNEKCNFGALSSKYEWAVGEDGEGIIEIRSRHLTAKDFPLVVKICEYVSSQQTSGNTSAHVHIGLPNDIDAFDKLAITTLVDENAIKIAAGRNRQLQTFAKLRDSLHYYIIHAILEKWPEEENRKDLIMRYIILDKLLNYLDRNHGTNLATDKNTVEFRYLSSDIASDSETFIQWIRYYLLLPQIATSRNKVILKSNKMLQTITAIRETDGARFSLNKTVKNQPMPAAYIRPRAEI